MHARVQARDCRLLIAVGIALVALRLLLQRRGQQPHLLQRSVVAAVVVKAVAGEAAAVASNPI